jgi:SAM-dependent methyltransferase
MVHALEKVHSLLKPGGTLIDIHPTGEPPAIEVHIDGQIARAGWLQETDDFVEYFQADDALADVVRRGLFAAEQASQFTFLTHAKTVAALRKFVVEEWSDAIFEEAVLHRGEELFSSPGRDKKAILNEQAHIARLRRIG